MIYNEWEYVRLGTVCEVETNNVNPQKLPQVIFQHFSLPSFDNGRRPEIQFGKDIKSQKHLIDGEVILFNKLNVKFKRVWNIRKDMLIEKSVCSTEFIPLKAKGINKDFLYYCLVNDEFTSRILGGVTGTSNSHQRIDVSFLLNQTVPKPNEKVQLEISKVLLSLDKKIDINNKIIQKLDEVMLSLYRSWFVDFSPFIENGQVESEIGLIPDNWRVVKLSEMMKYYGGSQPPSEEFVSDHKEGYVRFIQIRDFESDNYKTYIPISKKNKTCEKDDILIARYGASLGRICSGLKGAYNVALAKVVPAKDIYKSFLYCYLTSSEFYNGINSKGGRSAQSGFNQGDIDSFMIAIPKDEDILDKFEKIIKPMINTRLNLFEQNKNLSSTRELILPKLMSGEISTSIQENIL